MPSLYNLTRYKALKLWMAGPAGKVGLARIRALGVLWSPRALPEEIVDKMGQLESAPALPPLGTFRDKASFLAGSCWTMALIANRSKHQP